MTTLNHIKTRLREAENRLQDALFQISFCPSSCDIETQLQLIPHVRESLSSLYASCDEIACRIQERANRHNDEMHLTRVLMSLRMMYQKKKKQVTRTRFLEREAIPLLTRMLTKMSGLDEKSRCPGIAKAVQAALEAESSDSIPKMAETLLSAKEEASDVFQDKE